MKRVETMKLVTFVKKVENHIFNDIRNLGVFNCISDEKYIRMCWRRHYKKKLNLDKPVTYNEKLQWLKLNHRVPEYTTMVDKADVKEYVANLIGEEYIIPTLGVWDNFDKINFDILPDKFVLKCTHDSGGLVICKDKKNFDITAAKKKINKCLKRNYYLYSREWPYKNVKPRIIAEEYMVDETGTELKDYKIFCFNGEPKYIQVDYGRFTEHKRNVYTLDWEYIDMSIKFPTDSKVQISKPYNLEKMIELSKILSDNIPQVRVDFYSINEKIFFGELTFYHGSGYEKFTPKEWDYKFGDLIKLPDISSK